MTTVTIANTAADYATQGCFVSVHVSRPTLRAKLSWAELGLPEVEDRLATPPSCKPPSESHKEFGRLEAAMRAALRARSAGAKGGFRYTKFSQLPTLLGELEPLTQQYIAHADKFLSAYQSDVDAALREWTEKAGEVYDALANPAITRREFTRRLTMRLERAWPSADSIRDRFDARVEVLQFALPEAGGGVFSSNPDLIARARHDAQRTLDGFFAEAQAELRERAVEAVRRMHDVLAAGGTIRESSINPLREFIERFRELSLVPDRAFQGHLDGLVTLIADRGGAEGLRNDRRAWGEVQERLADVAQIGEELAREATTRRASPTTRAISID